MPIIAGNGVRIAQAYHQLEVLAGLIGAPVATSASGKGVYAETGDWALGVCGNFGQPTANHVIGQAAALGAKTQESSEAVAGLVFPGGRG